MRTEARSQWHRLSVNIHIPARRDVLFSYLSGRLRGNNMGKGEDLRAELNVFRLADTIERHYQAGDDLPTVLFYSGDVQPVELSEWRTPPCDAVRDECQAATGRPTPGSRAPFGPTRARVPVQEAAVLAGLDGDRSVPVDVPGRSSGGRRAGWRHMWQGGLDA